MVIKNPRSLQVSSLQESCFKEVTTKNGTRLVLSVSKTFMKLRDLILEKKSLEDRVEKMKAINTQLVRGYAAKLLGHSINMYCWLYNRWRPVWPSLHPTEVVLSSPKYSPYHTSLCSVSRPNSSSIKTRRPCRVIPISLKIKHD